MGKGLGEDFPVECCIALGPWFSLLCVLQPPVCPKAWVITGSHLRELGSPWQYDPVIWLWLAASLLQLCKHGGLVINTEKLVAMVLDPGSSLRTFVVPSPLVPKLLLLPWQCCARWTPFWIPGLLLWLVLYKGVNRNGAYSLRNG